MWGVTQVIWWQPWPAHARVPQETLYFFSQPSERAPAPGTRHQFSTASRAERSWEKTATEAAQISGGSTATSIPVLTPQFQSSDFSGPTYSSRQTWTRSRTSTTGKGLWPWATSEQNCRRLHRWCISPLWAHWPHFLEQPPPPRGKAYIRGGQSLIELGPQGFYSNNWGAYIPQQGSNCQGAERERKSCLTSCTGFRSPNTNQIPYQGG